MIEKIAEKKEKVIGIEYDSYNGMITWRETKEDGSLGDIEQTIFPVSEDGRRKLILELQEKYGEEVKLQKKSA